MSRKPLFREIPCCDLERFQKAKRSGRDLVKPGRYDRAIDSALPRPDETLLIQDLRFQDLRFQDLRFQDLRSRTSRKPRLLGGTPTAQPPARASRMKSVT